MKSPLSTLVSKTTLALFAVMMCAPYAMAAPKDTLNKTDVAFVKRAAASGMAKVKVADLGVKKASRADVKAFAEVIVADYTMVDKELKTLAATKGVELSAVIEPAQASTFQKLEKLSGTEFDKAFLAELVSSHKKGVSAYEDASKDSKDKDVKAFADKTLPTMKAHQAKAKKLSSK